MPIAEALFRRVRSRGVDTVFGIPGIHTLELYRGLARAGLRHVLARHEQGAAFMADGYARASGRPAVVLVITGPGLTNAATGIAQAYSDSVPMLVVTTVRTRADLGHERGRLHEIRDQCRLMEPITGFSRTIRSAECLTTAVDEAFALFERGRPRPVVLEFPLDVLDEHVANWKEPPLGEPIHHQAGALTAAAHLIADCASLVVIAGGGAVDAGKAVKGFVEKTGAILVTSVNGRGVAPELHPQNVGATMRCRGTLRLISEADVVVAVGTELAETDTWVDDFVLRGRLIRIDIDRDQANRNKPADVALVGDAGDLLTALAKRVPARPTRVEAVESVKRENRLGEPPLERARRAILDAIKRAAPTDLIVAADSTELAYTANIHGWIDQPRSYLHCTGFAALGYALPAAIGAKIAAPGRNVVAIVGDGGFQFTLQELATAVDERLAIPVVIWNNRAYGAIIDEMKRRDVPEIGVRLNNPDFLILGQSYGCYASRPESLGEVTAMVQAGLNSDRPTLIEIEADADFVRAVE